MTKLLEVENLGKSFIQKRNLLGKPTRRVQAVKDVSFTLENGQTVGIVGESGAGKSTVGRLVLRLIEPDTGTVTFQGTPLADVSQRSLRTMRQQMQMIFQDPFSSLDPRMVIRDAVGEPFTVHHGLKGDERDERVVELLRRVGIREDQLDRFPREFSGGQLQRIAIARALTTDPSLIVCDEPVAALDVSIQAQVLNLLLDLQSERGLGYVFISHDLSLVRFLAHHVVVMRHGEVMETGPTEQVFSDPQHEYTRKLISSIPVARPRRRKVGLAAG